MTLNSRNRIMNIITEYYDYNILNALNVALIAVNQLIINNLLIQNKPVPPLWIFSNIHKREAADRFLLS
jgi:hypothetical protein